VIRGCPDRVRDREPEANRTQGTTEMQITGDKEAAVLSTAADYNLKSLAMRTYLHDAALLLVCAFTVATLTPALAANSSVDDPKVIRKSTLGRRKSCVGLRLPLARAPLRLFRSARSHIPRTQLQTLTACQMVSIVILFDHSSRCLRRPRCSAEFKWCHDPVRHPTSP
jgi:hypothetical protein